MRRRTVGLVGAALAALLAGCTGSAATAPRQHQSPAPARPTTQKPAPPDTRPNIVLVLMDDASYELMATMPHLQRMRAAGATFVNAFVVDSLCCPSRASTLTGRPPHQTGVLTNTAGRRPRHPRGGYPAFAAHHDAAKAFNVALQRSGYTTGFIGKYLNGYAMGAAHGRRIPPPRIPGWDEFDAVLGSGYQEWGLVKTFLDRHRRLRLRRDLRPPRDSSVAVLDRHYATNVMRRDALGFLERHARQRAPYFLEIATYAPHAQLGLAYPDNPPFPPSFADRAPPGQPTGGNCGTRPCGDLSLRDLIGYGATREHTRPTYLRRDGSTRPAPAWNTGPVTLTPASALTAYRDRARMVQSVDRMIGRLRRATGPNTYFLVTSDNGFHLGQHQHNGGKGLPYDHDTRVPLVVVGPGVTPGPRRQFVSNLDLAPTFEELAGLRPAPYRSGTSFAASLHRPRAPGGRFVFFEHTHTRSWSTEVDLDVATGERLATVPSYVGVRGRAGLLVRVDLDDSRRRHRYAWELYRDLPLEDRSVFARDHDKPYARELMRRLRRWLDCAPAQCRAAAR